MSRIIKDFIFLLVDCFVTITILCLLITHVSSSTEAEDNLFHPELDVLVLGAGLAGIGAALQLHESHVDNFLVLEAKDYIGGRLKEVHFFGETVAMGAGWIHKIEMNHKIYKLAQKYGLKTIQDSYAFNRICFRNGVFGYRFNKWTVNWNNRVVKKSSQKCMDYCDDNPVKCQKMTLRQCLEKGGWDIKSIEREKIRESIDYFMFDFENAGPPENMSAWQMSYTGEGTDLVVIDPRGYNYPLLMEIMPFRYKFQLNTEVKSVVATEDNKYIVTTSNGRTYKAKHVIVTFSSGVLSAEKVNFAPKLPSWKMDALKYVPMGHYCKFFFKFPYTFWEEDATYILLGTEPRGYYSHWQNMNQAHFYPGSSILLCTLTGDVCKEKEKLEDKVIIKEAMEVIRLQNMYKNAPDPIRIKRSSWSSDPHVLGAYSLPRKGVTPKHYLALEHPIQQSLWFTGEYASQELFGYTHGAYTHGEVIAERVVKCLLHKICPGDRPEDVK